MFTMKKSYIAPVCEIVKLNTADIIATSGGVGDGGAPGREYFGGDVSYGRDGWFDDDEW